MLRIGEFSKLSKLTVKALRFYEKEGLLMPCSIDRWTGYRYYEPEQLSLASKIKLYRCLGLSIVEIKAIIDGADEKSVLEAKLLDLNREKDEIDTKLSLLRFILEGKDMQYQVTVKEIPEYIVYTVEKRLEKYSDIMTFVPMCGEECLKLNPDLKCTEPPYEFCEYPDYEYKLENLLVRHSEAVEKFGNESEFIRFRRLPKAKVLSIYHKGPYEYLGEAYAFIAKYAKDNGYESVGLPRECYIDGIWNKESPDEWLTEIQLPIA